MIIKKCENKKDILRVMRLGFIILTVIALVSGTVRAVFLPREINNYESRPSEQMPALTWDGFADLSFQDDVEEALADQIPMAQYFKKFYNLMKIKYQELASFPVIDNNPDKYYTYGRVVFFDDYLVYPSYKLEDVTQSIDEIVGSYNDVVLASPQTQFYFYFVESDHDINFETGDKSGIYDYIKSISVIPQEHFDKYPVDNFEDYKAEMCVTDHHWNGHGAYNGYLDVFKLLDSAGEPLTPLEEVSFPRPWRGSKANVVGYDSKQEILTAYRFDFPEMTVTIDGSVVPDYGHQNDFFANPDSVISYGNFYGDNYQEVILETGMTDRENLLVIGDSYTHALLKLVASSYNTTVLLDPRYSDIDKESLTEYIKVHNIDKVLFLEYTHSFSDLRFVIEG